MRLSFPIEFCRDRIAASFLNYGNNLVFAVLVPCKAAVATICSSGHVIERTLADGDAKLLIQGNFRKVSLPRSSATPHPETETAVERELFVFAPGRAELSYRWAVPS